MGWLRDRARNLRRQLDVWRLVAKDPRTPRAAKWLLGLAVAYILSPIDLVPDFIPIVGYLDDALVVPALGALAMSLVPEEVKEDARRAAEAKAKARAAKPRRRPPARAGRV